MYHDNRGRLSAHHTLLPNMYHDNRDTTPCYLKCTMITEVGSLLTTPCYLIFLACIMNMYGGGFPHNQLLLLDTYRIVFHCIVPPLIFIWPTYNQRHFWLHHWHQQLIQQSYWSPCFSYLQINEYPISNQHLTVKKTDFSYHPAYI